MSAKRGNVLEVRGLSKSFDGRPVLEDVTFDVADGEIVVVIGPSGCGKSTVLNCVIGALRPDRGSVRVFGEEIDYDDRVALDRLRLRYGVLFQGGALFTSLTVAENVALPLRRHTRLDAETIDIMVKMKLAQVGLSQAANKLPEAISGGMKKRAALARAIALDPKLLLCDEPSAGLDPVSIAVIDKLVRDLTRALRISMVVVTHEMRSAFRIADRMVMLYRGKVVANGTVDEIRDSEDPLVRQFTDGTTDGPMELASEDRLADELLGSSGASE